VEQEDENNRERLRSLERGTQRTLPLSEGAVGIVAGPVAVLWPGLTTSGLVYVIAGWAVLTGVLKILTAIRLRTRVDNGWLLAGSGSLSVLFGIQLVVLADSDVPFLAPFIGGFAVVVGLALLVFAFRLRKRRR
jgi:uncharacterized membrane protein HdeD (DUF308 family)